MNAVNPNLGQELAGKAADTAFRVATQAQQLFEVASNQLTALSNHLPQGSTAQPRLKAPVQVLEDAAAYAVDATQRFILFADIMRRAGNTFVAHEAAGCPPVLVFQYEMVVDGHSLPRPVNYALVRIVPPAGTAAPNPALRPFVIVDPRAGHGAGIGGFKSDSQVGVALHNGHPVYFVIFFRDPQPGQTLLDVTEAEGQFLRKVAELHPHAPKPVVVGNCQGGWAVMMLGTAHPDLTGPLVLNGAPLSYWAGKTGKNPMRYLGGLSGGSWPASLLADLGNGRFDGANLVMNFESMSPGNTWFRKYYDLFAKADTEAERFLEFERWWVGFFLMNDDEIRWIVQNLFIGDRFAKGSLRSSPGHAFDIKALRQPVVVFASAGDNITPPGQALRWIADVYHDEEEIKARGQTIIYLLHEGVGHLGIFVSGAIAKKEHAEIANTLEMIEAVAPGLYEMRITGAAGSYQVELIGRTVADIRDLSGEAKNEAFPAVAKVSGLYQQPYDVLARPLVRQMATEAGAEARRQLHPMRARRTLASDRNPLMWPFQYWAPLVQQHRAAAAPDNVLLAMERAWADAVEQGLNSYRDLRDGMMEVAFHAVYGTLAATGLADDPLAEPPPVDTSNEGARREALAHVALGGYAEAVVRMMVLLAAARGGVRRSRLARSNALLHHDAPFAEMSEAARQELIREQTAIVTLAPAEALAALPVLLPDPAERARAMAAVAEVAGPEDDLGEAARGMLARQRKVLGLG